MPADVLPFFTAIDLFAGAGGLSLGASWAGFRILLANDIDHWACETYRWNHHGAQCIEAPIETLEPEDVLARTGLRSGELDLLLGGPPCQGFSIYAPKRRPDDPRNGLIGEYLRFVRGLRPKYLVLENVPGLLSMENGKALMSFLDGLAELGYHASYRVLLAARYGVPQERWRLAVLGWREDMPPVGFPPATHRANARANFTRGNEWEKTEYAPNPANAVRVSEAIGDLPPLENGGSMDGVPYPPPRGPLTPYQRWARSYAAILWNHIAPKLSRINLERLKYILPGGSWRDIPFDLLPKGMKRARRSDHTKRYGRMDPNGLSCTILTKCDPHWGSYFHYDQDRAISVREAARLQSFPDHYRFLGPLTAQFEQVGNAVPPLFAAALCRSVRSGLEIAYGTQHQTAVRL